MSSHSPHARIHVRDGLCLSEMRESDKAALVRHLNDPDIYKHTLRIPFPYTQQDAETFIDIAVSATDAYGHPVHFAIRDQDDELIGGCGFEDLSHGHRAEVGYWLAKPFWGRGIMSDVVRAACALAQTQWRLIRITAHTFVFNRASARVLEKNGFQLEGLLRKHHRKNDEFLDSNLYALVSET